MASSSSILPMFKDLAFDVQIDAAGDLKLLVQHGEEWVTFQVSSKAMSLASPVWRRMLDPNGPFRESRSDNNKITFPDDDSEALLILLLAAHLRFQDVPQEVWFQQLLNVCILCDKYDCITLVRPWISRWQAREIHLAGQYKYEEWMFVAWTTGDKATFERAGRTLISNATTDESGIFSDTRLSGLEMPPGFVEMIPHARLQTITKLIELTHTFLDRKELRCEAHRCVKQYMPNESEGCDDLTTGSLIRQLRETSLPTPLWPGRPAKIASLYSGSAQSLACILEDMKCKIYPTGRHESCGFETELKIGVEEILAEMPSGMNDSHRRHMATQRSKLEQSHSFLGLLGRDHQPPSPEEEEEE